MSFTILAGGSLYHAQGLAGLPSKQGAATSKPDVLRLSSSQTYDQMKSSLKRFSPARANELSKDLERAKANGHLIDFANRIKQAAIEDDIVCYTTITSDKPLPGSPDQTVGTEKADVSMQAYEDRQEQTLQGKNPFLGTYTIGPTTLKKKKLTMGYYYMWTTRPKVGATSDTGRVVFLQDEKESVILHERGK